MKVNLVGDRLVGECADAVLRLSDGELVECSKFVMMASCPVLRAMLELRSEVRDGKYVIPVSDVGKYKYEKFCKLLHRVEDVHSMTFEDLVGVHECARRFGCEDVERTTLLCAWELAPSPRTASMAEFLPHLLLVGPVVVAEVVHTATVELPLWTDLVRVFLEPLSLTNDIARELLALQRHYPPAAVAKWLLTHLPREADEDLVFELATENSHLYGADETRAVYEELIRLYKSHPTWDRRVSKFAFAALESSAWNNHVGVVGTYVEYEDIPRTTVYATFSPDHKWKKTFLLAPSVRVRMPRGKTPFGFDVRAGILERATFQVRVTASKRLSMLDPFFEAWYEFEGAPTDGWTPSPAPTASHGELPPGSNGNRGFVVRIDIRHGDQNALRRPYAST